MKKMMSILAFALIINGAFAQTPGAGAAAGKDCSNDSFAWGIGLGMLAVMGIIVGVTVVASTQASH